MEMQKEGKGKDGVDGLIYRVIGCMIEVHKQLGPGFLENVYRRALPLNSKDRTFGLRQKKKSSCSTRGDCIGTHRLDLFVEDQLVVELKTVDELHKKHYAQVRSYLKAVQRPVGLLANFAEFQLNSRRVELNH